MSAQHPIDLMPAALRQRSEAGVRMGQSAVAAVVTLAVLVIGATHSRFALTRAQAELNDISSRAEVVFAAEKQAESLGGELAEINAYIDRYQRIAHPLEISSVIATLVNLLPEGASLDQLDMDAGPRTVMRGPRSSATDGADKTLPRVLHGEVSGFARSDEQIAEFVTRLAQTQPFQDVSLDFSRTREVNGHPAREFRLSFRIDFDQRYTVVSAGAPALPAGIHAAVHAPGRRSAAAGEVNDVR